MKRILMAALALALGCDEVRERPTCESSTECGAGAYCAAVDGKRSCWPDTTAPIVSTTNVTCEPHPCAREGTILLVALASDDHALAEVEARIDVAAEGGSAGTSPHTFPMIFDGAAWRVNIRMGELPFDHFEGVVRVRFAARDLARNELVTDPRTVGTITRRVSDVVLSSTAGFKPTAPAVMPDGTVVVGGTTGALYSVSTTGAVRSLAVGAGQITAAPAVGERAIWVGSEDGKLYGVSLDRAGVLPNVGVDTLGAITGAVAVESLADREWGFVASASGRLGAASTVGPEFDRTAAIEAFTTGPVIDSENHVFAATASTTAVAARRCYPFDGAAFADSCGIGALGTIPVNQPFAIDGASRIVAASPDAKLYRSDRVEPLATLVSASADSPVILASGDILVGDLSGFLNRLDTNGTLKWTSPILGSAVLAPLVLSNTTTPFIVPTKGGKVFALRDDGTIAWEVQLTSAELRTGGIYTPPGQSGTAVFSTVSFPATDGHVYAILVDGKLDSAAPWPKAFHDARNTNNAGTQP